MLKCVEKYSARDASLHSEDFVDTIEIYNEEENRRYEELIRFIDDFVESEEYTAYVRDKASKKKAHKGIQYNYQNDSEEFERKTALKTKRRTLTYKTRKIFTFNKYFEKYLQNMKNERVLKGQEKSIKVIRDKIQQAKEIYNTIQQEREKQVKETNEKDLEEFCKKYNIDITCLRPESKAKVAEKVICYKKIQHSRQTKCKNNLLNIVKKLLLEFKRDKQIKDMENKRYDGKVKRKEKIIKGLEVIGSKIILMPYYEISFSSEEEYESEEEEIEEEIVIKLVKEKKKVKDKVKEETEPKKKGKKEKKPQKDKSEKMKKEKKKKGMKSIEKDLDLVLPLIPITNQRNKIKQESVMGLVDLVKEFEVFDEILENHKLLERMKQDCQYPVDNNFFYQPKVLEFRNFQEGKTYKKKIRITNITYKSKKCRFWKAAFMDEADLILFQIEQIGIQKLYPGVSFTLTITFAPKENEKTVEGTLNFLSYDTKNSKYYQFSIPVLCVPTYSDLSILPGIVSFGKIPEWRAKHDNNITKTITLRKIGAKTCRIVIQKVNNPLDLDEEPSLFDQCYSLKPYYISKQTGAGGRSNIVSSQYLPNFHDSEGFKSITSDNIYRGISIPVLSIPDVQQKHSSAKMLALSKSKLSKASNTDKTSKNTLKLQESEIVSTNDQILYAKMKPFIEECIDNVFNTFYINNSFLDVKGDEERKLKILLKNVDHIGLYYEKYNIDVYEFFKENEMILLGSQVIEIFLEVTGHFIKVQPEVLDFEECFYNSTYQEGFVVQNHSNAIQAIAVKFPPYIIDYIEANVTNLYIPPGEKRTVWIKFYPRVDISIEHNPYFNKITSILEFPIYMRVMSKNYLDTPPVKITAFAILSPPDHLTIEPKKHEYVTLHQNQLVLDLGECSIYETVYTDILLRNNSFGAQLYCFTNLPECLTIMPNYGSGELLEEDVEALRIYFHPALIDIPSKNIAEGERDTNVFFRITVDTVYHIGQLKKGFNYKKLRKSFQLILKELKTPMKTQLEDDIENCVTSLRELFPSTSNVVGKIDPRVSRTNVIEEFVSGDISALVVKNETENRYSATTQRLMIYDFSGAPVEEKLATSKPSTSKQEKGAGQLGCHLHSNNTLLCPYWSIRSRYNNDLCKSESQLSVYLYASSTMFIGGQNVLEMSDFMVVDEEYVNCTFTMHRYWIYSENNDLIHTLFYDEATISSGSSEEELDFFKESIVSIKPLNIREYASRHLWIKAKITIPFCEFSFQTVQFPSTPCMSYSIAELILKTNNFEMLEMIFGKRTFCANLQNFEGHFEIIGNNPLIQIEPICGEIKLGQEIKFTLVSKPEIPDVLVRNKAKTLKYAEIYEAKRKELELERERQLESLLKKKKGKKGNESKNDGKKNKKDKLVKGGKDVEKDKGKGKEKRKKGNKDVEDTKKNSTKTDGNKEESEIIVKNEEIVINYTDLYPAEMYCWRSLKPFYIFGNFCCKINYAIGNRNDKTDVLYINTMCKVVQPDFITNVSTQRIEFGNTVIGMAVTKPVYVKNIKYDSIYPKMNLLNPVGPFKAPPVENAEVTPEYILNLPITFEPKNIGKVEEYLEIRTKKSICSLILDGIGVSPEIIISPDFQVYRIQAKGKAIAECPFEFVNKCLAPISIKFEKVCEIEGVFKRLQKPKEEKLPKDPNDKEKKKNKDDKSSKKSKKQKPAKEPKVQVEKFSNELTEEEVESIKNYFIKLEGDSNFDEIPNLDIEPTESGILKIRFGLPQVLAESKIVREKSPKKGKKGKKDQDKSSKKSNKSKKSSSKGSKQVKTSENQKYFIAKYNIILGNTTFLKDIIIIGTFV